LNSDLILINIQNFGIKRFIMLGWEIT